MDKKKSSNFRKRKFMCHFFTKSGRRKQTMPSYDLFLYSIQTSSLKYLSQAGRRTFFVLISPDEPGRSWPSRPQNSNSAYIQIDGQLADPNQKVRMCAINNVPRLPFRLPHSQYEVRAECVRIATSGSSYIIQKNVSHSR
ncbi:hypothetical protein MAP00_001401 [Monascus purpureus]|nr:hypothetical protein MAP00_001401 [Monascus purpureus]